MILNTLTLSLPNWADPYLQQQGNVFSEIEARMQLVIELATRNVKSQTGGPFGAAVFEQESGHLISIGVNLVVNQGCSLAHAEMLALALAQQSRECYSLNPKQTGITYQLVSSVAPCAMCLGAIPWSGVTSLVCGARGEDAEAIGFDEGDKPDNWQNTLTKRGILIVVDVLRPQAQAVLEAYQSKEGPIY